MGTLALLLWTVTGAALLNPATAHDGPVVQTKLGALKGEYVTAKGKDTVVHTYLSVPFAKPPVGPLRLAPPQPAEAWEGVRDATQQPHFCIQNRRVIMNILEKISATMEVPEVSEDCLYLNVYTPTTPGENTKLPVMVWIHGGGLILGGASLQDGSVLAAYQNVVVVIIQYRLGLFGYFSTGDEHAPGNYGLLDQVAALQWVQENIHSFGGDPGAVTIFGESAGGVSVSLQILSPLSAGLFHFAIAESGTAAMDALMTDNPLPIAQQVANASGCDISSTKKMVDCVMQLSAEDILKTTQRMAVSFQVTKDGQFLPKSVHELLQNKEFKKVPFIVGVNDDEGGYTLMDFLASPGWIDGMNREQVMSALPYFFPDPSEKWVHEVVLNEYLDSTDDPIKIRDGVREMYGDLMFNIPTRKVAKYHKDSGAPVYLYEFQHTYNEIKKRRPSFVGSDHADEIHFVFGSCFANAHIKMSGQFTEKENELCRTVMHYWGNFARTGSPNGPGLTPWPEYGTEAEYLGIGLEQKAGKNLKGKHYTFMTETLPRLIREKKGGPVVQTNLGALKGEYVTAKGTDTVVHTYLGVPFAKPPVGPLRLAPPQPAEAWEGVRDATQQPHLCIQHRALLVDDLQQFLMNFEVPEMSEDCLYLNIYTPSKPGEDAKLPVMVWIHGGALTVGSASMQEGSVLAAYQNVVVVVIQYRLGLLGFFSTGDEHAPGNYGLLDQVAALQWVQENIHSFGGDPGAVTIFGESAGGVSVSLQILSPLSAGLFRSAIAESGTAAMDAIMTDNPLPIAQHLAEVSGCDISSTKKMVDCVMQLSEEDLQRVAETEGLFSVKVPKDGRFLPKSVYGLLKNKQFSKVPLITGVTDDDGGYSLISFLLPPGWTDGISREQVMSIMPFFFSGVSEDPAVPSEKWVHEVVLNEYLGSTDDPIKIRDGVREMYGDLMFNIPTRKVAKYHKGSGAPVYLYEFQHTYSEIKKRRPSFVGSDHGDELHFVFGSCFANAHIKMSGQFTEKENELCRTVMHYWGNFARTGSPNGPGLTPWPEYGTEAEYLGIGLEQKAGKNLKGKHYTFMTETLPRLIREKKGGPVVQTKLGALKGEYVTAKGTDTVIHTYLGVPFAKPPVGPLRLAPPQPAEAWEGVRDATQQPRVCIQHRAILVGVPRQFLMNFEAPEMSEDCLYLNIYTPSKPGEDAELPVMVWIHGGGFTVGSASMQEGSVLAAYQNVVVVVIQYRLGLLGFFSTGDEHAPGNYGLLDQVAALQWVQKNIKSFGGDPGAVTIFGESAGGISVSLQILSPLSAGLFRSAIAESGTAAMDALMTDNPLPIAQHLAEVSGCDISSTKKMVDCVMQLSEEDLQRVAETEGLVSVKVPKDGRFLPKSVYGLLKNKQFSKVPLITGVTDDDGGYLLINFLLPPGWTDGISREQVMSIMPFFFSGVSEDPAVPSEKWVHEVVLNEYLGSTDDPIKIRDGVREMYGDLMFNIPTRKVAKYHKGSGAPVYLYEFQHTYSEIKKRRPSFVGSDHGDELHFVFGSCFANAHIKMSGQFTEKENELCRTVMHYWGNFARTGSPNGPGLTPWPEYGTEAEYLGIGLEQKAGKNLKGKHYTFMTETLPRLIREKKGGPVVQTKLGALKGEYVTAKGTDTVIHTYLGVPFAKPPVGPLRLAPPQPAEAWEGVRDATQQPRVCIQHRAILVGVPRQFLMNFEAPEMSEDCLYLNIYTPSKPGEDAELPVMVWIHGGGFTVGSASMQEGSVLAAYQNVIVVVIQYRLGLLGFFSTGDEHAPGNYGLLDQVAALQWVQKNIKSFGGDPGAVTIFGESAGGISVSLQILSPLSAGLFRSAIAESGTAAMDALMTDNPLPIAQHLAEVSGCDISSTKKMVDCVMQLSEEDLQRVAETEGLVSVKVPKDGRFLPKSVYGLLKNKQFSKVPLITGVTDDDGGYLLINFLLPPGWTDGISREQVMSIMPFFFSGPSEKWVHEVVLNEYLGSTDDPIKIRDGLREMYGDLMFNIPTRKVAKYHKGSGAPVYLYEFQHTYSEIKKRRPSFVGSDHYDEIHFVFGSCFANAHIKMSGQFTEKENELCRTVMHYWGNFARTGSPNGPGLTPWPEYGTEAEYLGIGLEQKAGKNLKGKHYTFMTETLPRLIREKKGGPVVQTKLGALKGEYVTAKGTDTVIHTYLGVPFAKPPVGPLRLAPPQPAEAWEGVRDATQQPRVCIQHRAMLVGVPQQFLMNFEAPEMSEDCLYLNIYTPSKPGEDAELPVMVWIHGGGFTVGSASMQEGSVLAAYQNVVVVVIQYRLGLLGFFSTGDEHAPGNYGLLDQVAALQWVQKNIKSFGGDPGAVTIFGESAGGISVSLQILSPLSAGLFRSAIAESGTAAMDALMTDNPLPIAQHLAEVSGCDISSTKKMVDCVMQLSEEDLQRVAETEGLVSVKVPKDGRFLPKSVYGLLKNKQFSKVPLITGVTDDDGGYLLINFLLPPGWTDGISREQVMSIMPFFFSGPSEKWVHEVVLNEYLGSTDDPIKIRDGVREMCGDLMFNIPTRKVAKYHKGSGAPVYLYEFQHTYSEIKKRRPSFVGSDHYDEIHFVFGSCFANAHIKMSGQFTEKENELCRTVMHYWGNFARTGSPNGPGLTPWPEYGTEAEYLGIGLEQKAGKNLKGKHYTFMTETLPRLIREKKGGPVVQTKLGALKGEYVTAEGTDTVVHTYLGVPFAKPPVGPLRLAPPQPAEAWEGVRDATQQPCVCIQHRAMLDVVFQHFFMNFEAPEMSEDCLYLNIYTPSKPAKDAKLPVMVWIHGGALTIGSASMQEGSVLAAYQNVVVVVIQYRLGLLGFFSTGDEHAPGNYGLLDQVAALQWVQKNINSFGGDPGAVTIFGASAGGVSVSLQILSPLSAGLFRSAIAESGTAAMDAIMTDNPLPIAQHLAEVSGCDISSTKKMVDCVMQLSEEDLQRVAETEGLFSVKVPKDGRFLPKSVYGLLKNKQFSKVPLITGVTDDDGGYSLISAHLPPVWIDGVNREQVMSIMPFFFSGPSEKWVHEVVLNEYLGSTDDPIKIRDGLREMYGDLMFNIPTRKVAKYHKDSGAPVYLYEFQHTYNEIKKRRPSFVGSDHADEIHFVFGRCFANAHIKMSGQFTEKENELCRIVMAYWGNFARTGSPNGPGLTPWPEYGTEAEYLGIGLEQKAGKNLKGKHYTFMTETLPRLIREKKDGPVVQTKLGALKGEYVTAKGKGTVVHSYLGVPFAKPPVGPLRLAPPQPAEAWEGVRDATQQPHMCIQNRQALADLFANFTLRVELPEMSEDCLYLNIYTPAKPGDDANLPVMVWIHGGGLSVGSASIYDGSILSAYQNVVVVLIQYRLGLLGFFSTGDEHAPGNYGLLDQVAALQWVQKNIHSFGGDPGSVTIFGESAGGASVSFLLLSPLSAGLFHRAIAQSGCATMAGIVADPLPVAQQVANASGCDISSTQKIAECIKQWSREDMITLSNEHFMLRFVVTEDKAFLPKPVEELLQNQEFSKVPLLTGINDDEYGWVMPSIIGPPGWADGMDREQVLSSIATFMPDVKKQWINELIADEYLGSSADQIKIRDNYKEMMADIIFNIPALKLAKFHKAAGAPVYLYQFQQPPSFIQAKRPSFVRTDHGDDLFFVFGLCFGNAHVRTTASVTEKEKELCRTVMAYWGNFARTGSPNGPDLTPWPEYGAEAEYLGIGLEQKPGRNLKAERYIFMTEKLPELVRSAQEKREHSEL